jgi:hypothetical protein
MSEMRVPGDSEQQDARLWRHADGATQRSAVPPLRTLVADAVDEALKNVPPPAKAELDQLSERTRADLRLQLLESVERSNREAWASVLAMQSSEKSGSRLVIATWGLVCATVGLVIATVVLVLVTVSDGHGSQTSSTTPHGRISSQPHTRSSS